MRTTLLQNLVLTVATGLAGCSATAGSPVEVGGATGLGGATGTGGSVGAGGSTTMGGATGLGGATNGGGTALTGGAPSNGGNSAAGGSSAGTSSSGGAASGGAKATGGASSGGAASGGAKATGGASSGGAASGGAKATGGASSGGAGTGGAKATGGASTGGASSAGATSVDCSGTVPSGGTVHNSANASGTAAGLSWSIWSNGSGGSITTYSTPAFSAAWNNSSDFLARIGLQWDKTKTYDQYGTITAQFAEKKTGTAGGYSYVGIYGWSVTPCIEFYIVDDSFKTMPVNPGSGTNKGTASIDGGTYNLYLRNTTGTGGNRCGSSVTSWDQFYSIRTTARQCGQISVTDHFNAWKAAGMTLGKMDQAQIVIEVGGGTGSIDFTTANMSAK